jgi:hypothetical protein
VARLLAAGLVLFLLAGCGGDRVGEAAPPTEVRTRAAGGGITDARPGRVLVRFVEAARRGDAGGMWALLSKPTRASIGPTLAQFRSGSAQQLGQSFRSMTPTTAVVLSRRLGGGLSVAAISGERTVKGKREDFAYGAALVAEDGVPRLELDGLVFGEHQPEPLDRVDEGPVQVRAKVSAGDDVTDVRAWLDGRPLRLETRTDDAPFTATVRGRPASPPTAGRHVIVVFAATSLAAGASAWIFTVGD